MNEQLFKDFMEVAKNVPTWTVYPSDWKVSAGSGNDWCVAYVREDLPKQSACVLISMIEDALAEWAGKRGALKVFRQNMNTGPEWGYTVDREPNGWEVYVMSQSRLEAAMKALIAVYDKENN